MRRCLSCDARFEEKRRVCPKDGDVLITEGVPAPETGRLLGDRYRLGNQIGEGGMGQVFEARRLGDEVPVAIKILRSRVANARAEERFRIEAHAMVAVIHPGIVKIIEYGKSSDGSAYMVMERLFGPTFTELRRAGKFASPERVVALMKEACDVVAAAHAKQIVHRDLKPSNLLLHRESAGRSVVKVLDFGVAKFLEQSSEHLTRTGEMVGTILYMAPEQGKGETVGPAADVYSLGSILFESLAGRLPFTARSSVELMWLQSSVPTPSLATFRPDISDDLDALVAHCLAKKPEHRFPDAAALALALGEVDAVRSTSYGAASRGGASINPSAFLGSVLDGRYELHEWLAPGRFGSQVYLATHMVSGATVAVRFWPVAKGAVRDLLFEAFRIEARAMGVRHANLISILDLGFTPEGVYLVTELIDSSSLRALLDRRGALPPKIASELALGAAQGLAALHEGKIVSGGLSPETIRVTGSLDRPEKMLLSPFGLTNLKQVELLIESVGPASQGERALDYISPEQRAGAPPDARSDLYSLGLILLEMLGGDIHDARLVPTVTAEPLGELSLRPRRNSVRTPPHVLPAELSEPWKAFFRRAIAPRPSDRFQSAVEFEAALPRS